MTKKNIPLIFLILAIFSLIIIILITWYACMSYTEPGMGGMGRGLVIAFVDFAIFAPLREKKFISRPTK